MNLALVSRGVVLAHKCDTFDLENPRRTHANAQTWKRLAAEVDAWHRALPAGEQERADIAAEVGRRIHREG